MSAPELKLRELKPREPKLHGATPREPDAAQVGEILATWRVAPNALMLLGWQRERPSPDGTAILQRATKHRGRFTRFAWTAAPTSEHAYAFLAAVQLPNADTQAGETLLLASRQGSHDGVLARLPPFFQDSATFAAALGHAAAAAAPAVARFLMDVFTPTSIAANPGIRAMVAGFLEHASEPDGCIEMLGGIREHYALLQGWGLPLQGGCDVILAGAAFRRYTAREASFPRPDIIQPSLGQALVLPADAAEAGVVDTVFLLARNGIRRRHVLPERRMLSEAETAAHCSDLLPRVRCDADTRAILIAALRPRYDGRLTLYERGHPVRLNVDLGVSAEHAGCYLTGWLYDPAGTVESVRFRTAPSFNLRLDDRWTRIPRPDVTEGFSADPALPACEPSRHGHGFAVHVPHASVDQAGASSPAEQPYLEVAMHDGWCGFVPLAPVPLKGHDSHARLVASVDLHKPSGLVIIDRHLAPFFANIAARPPTVASALPAKLSWPSLIVVPLGPVEPPRALLSQLLQDPLEPGEGILFVCGDDWTDASIAALDRWSHFYGATAAAIRIAGPATVRTALSLAAEHSDAGRILLLGPGTVGGGKGWRGALRKISDEQGEDACVSPTVFYEDNSIRFAGCDGIEPLDAAPYVRVRRRLAGLPASFAPPGPTVPATGVSAACCLIPRSVLTGLQSQAATAAASLWEPELDLLLQLKQAGAACWWAPSVQVYAPDALPTGEPERASRLVGRWCVRAQLTTGGR